MGKKIMLDVLKDFRRGLNSDRPLELKNFWFTFSVGDVDEST